MAEVPVEFDVEKTLGLEYLGRYGRIGNLEFLLECWYAEDFCWPVVIAAEVGSMEVVRWFVERDCCSIEELGLALTVAVSRGRFDMIEYLLSCVPGPDLLDLMLNNEIFIAAGFLHEEWSEEAFRRGRMVGQAQHLNVIRVLRKGCSPLHLQELPLELQVSVAYFPLYKECSVTKTRILSHLLRGQLVEAAFRLCSGSPTYSEEILMKSTRTTLLSILESRLPRSFVDPPSCVG